MKLRIQVDIFQRERCYTDPFVHRLFFKILENLSSKFSVKAQAFSRVYIKQK